MNFRLILNFILSDWRSGELHLLLVALAIAVGTVASITLTVDRLQKAMTMEASVFLGADRSISSGKPIPDSIVAETKERNITTSSLVVFNSMVLSSADNTRSQLASVKAVESNYPLRGKLRVAEEPFGPTTETTEIPNPGEIWMNSRLLYGLDVSIGDQVEVGYAPLTVTRVLETEPDRGFSMLDLSPRVLMRMEDIEATRVIQPGSQIDYRFLMVGDDATFRGLYRAVEDDLEGYRWRTVRDSDERIGRALGRAENFFLIGGSMAVLLAGVAIALSANRYARRHFDHVGILKTLGARPRSIFWGCIGLLLFIGMIGILLGLLIGALVHFGLVWYLTEYILNTVEEVPPASLVPVLTGLVTGLICLFAFAFPPFLDLISVSPIRVIRRDFRRAGVSSVVTYTCAITGILGLLIWYSGSWEFTLWLLLGIVLVTTAFGTTALLLLRTGRLVGMQAGSVWRLALSGLQRRNVENVGQIVVFSLVIMLLMILYLVRSSLVDEWQQQLPPDTPNHIFFNISQDQHADVKQFIDTYATDGDLAAFYDGRVVAVNGEPVREYQRTRHGMPAGPRLSSGRQLTWSEDVPANNTVSEGEWWTANDSEPLVSVEKDYAMMWGLKLEDVLTFRIGGEMVDVKVANYRELEWGENAQFNFFFVFSPSVFENIPSSYRAMIRVPDEHRPELSQLIARNPTMTVIDVDSIIKQVQSVIDRVTLAVEWILILVLTSGALVLLASIQASRDNRIKEHALLRSMGGTRKLVLGSLTAEFLLLGLMAGLVAVFGAELSLYLIESKLLEFNYSMRPEIWAGSLILGGSIVATVGYLSTRKLVKLPPVAILRDAG